MTVTAQKNSTYVSPAFRSRNPTTVTAKKTALKKEFAIEQTAFPSLGETIKKTGTPISFSSAAAKKIVVPEVKIADVLPGWVHIRKYQGVIQYKYGKDVLLQDDGAEEIRSRIILKNRIAREEYDRTLDIERLGDLSEFYGQPPLAELFENDMTAAAFREDENDSSDYTESDYNE